MKEHTYINYFIFLPNFPLLKVWCSWAITLVFEDQNRNANKHFLWDSLFSRLHWVCWGWTAQHSTSIGALSEDEKMFHIIILSPILHFCSCRAFKAKSERNQHLENSVLFKRCFCTFISLKMFLRGSKLWSLCDLSFYSLTIFVPRMYISGKFSHPCCCFRCFSCCNNLFKLSVLPMSCLRLSSVFHSFLFCFGSQLFVLCDPHVFIFESQQEKQLICTFWVSSFCCWLGIQKLIQVQMGILPSNRNPICAIFELTGFCCAGCLLQCFFVNVQTFGCHPNTSWDHHAWSKWKSSLNHTLTCHSIKRRCRPAWKPICVIHCSKLLKSVFALQCY